MKSKISNLIVQNNDGFSLAQLIVAMVILLLLATATFIWIDPLTKIGESKNVKRTQDIETLAGAISKYADDHKGVLPILGLVNSYKRVLCSSQSGSALTCDGTSKNCLKIDDDDFYKYINALPHDPDKSSTADTGYYLQEDTDGFLVVGACDTYDSVVINRKLPITIGCAQYSAYGGGRCWYLYSVTNVSCDTVCQTYFNLDCVENAKYGPDVDVNGDAFCQLNADVLGLACTGTCTKNTTGTPPWFGSGTSCTIQPTVVNCSQLSGSGNIPICACE